MAKSMHVNKVCVGARLGQGCEWFGTGKLGVLVIALPVIFLKPWAILYLPVPCFFTDKMGVCITDKYHGSTGVPQL